VRCSSVMSKRRISPAEQEQDDLRVALTGVHQESDKDVVGGCGQRESRKHRR
jgi:hypothetical protein